jgi:pilus assembly protein Flp/PilA
MKNMMKDMVKKLRDEKGATAVEYGVMVALIAVAIIGAVTLVGTNLNTVFGNVSGALTGV